MGCDIHAHLEIRAKGEWFYYSPVEISRNYHLFTKMAGVRQVDGVIAISKPRGLPSDISGTTRLHYKYWEGDAHSESWLSSEEIDHLIEWRKDCDQIEGVQDLYANHELAWGYRKQPVWLFGNQIYRWRENHPDYPDYLEDIRLVFWFDN